MTDRKARALTVSAALFALALIVAAFRAPALRATNFFYPVTSPIKQWYDSRGQPLSNGYVYFGVANQNPQTSPITMYWDPSGLIPAAQPFRTSGGYIYRQGSPANVYAAGDFSCSVFTSAGTLVFTQPTSVDLQLALSIAGASSAAAIPVADAGNYYTHPATVETAFQQVGPLILQMVTALAGTVPTGATYDYPGSTGTVAPTGYVYCAGKTLGDASSGSTERANADTQALFVVLWNNSTNSELQLQNLSGSNIARSGVGALTDYGAHCRLSLPDCRGRVRAGLGTMSGTSDIARITSAGSGVNGATPLTSGATQTHTMTSGELVSHTHTFTGTAHNHTATDSGHTHSYFQSLNANLTTIATTGTTAGNAGGSTGTTGSGNAVITVANTTAGGTNSSTGSTTPFSVVQPTIIFTTIIKL